MKKNLMKLFSVAVLPALIISCRPAVNEQSEQKQYVVQSNIIHPDWVKDAVIYEVNIRQHTKEGTFNAFTEDLPRLSKLGIDILWLMPVHPIGEKNRKGPLGSYYSVKDYYSTNPEFGTTEDLKNLVNKAHSLGMYVILDWVPNHSAWDNELVVKHPDWYAKDTLGNMYSPRGWVDVVKFDYNNKDLRTYMTGALKYWITEVGVDGYRCDVAGDVPCDYWNEARASLDSLSKPIFMLAENENKNCLLEEAFSMNYGWELHHIMNDIAAGEKTVEHLKTFYAKHDTLYEPNIIQMNFLTNHDENTWRGTISERYGEAAEVYALMIFTVPGMPLLYSGQEVGLDKRLEFFERDPVEWKESEWTDIYKKFIDLKTNHSVFWNGDQGGSFEIIESVYDDVFAFQRKDTREEAIVILNFSDSPRMINFNNTGIKGEYSNAFSDENIDVSRGIKLGAYSYSVLLNEL